MNLSCYLFLATIIIFTISMVRVLSMHISSIIFGISEADALRHFNVSFRFMNSSCSFLHGTV